MLDRAVANLLQRVGARDRHTGRGVQSRLVENLGPLQVTASQQPWPGGRRKPRPPGNDSVRATGAENTDTVEGAMVSLLNNGKTPTHRLADAQRDGVPHRRVA